MLRKTISYNAGGVGTENILKGDSDFILIIFMGFLLAVLPTNA